MSSTKAKSLSKKCAYDDWSEITKQVGIRPLKGPHTPINMRASICVRICGFQTIVSAALADTDLYFCTCCYFLLNTRQAFYHFFTAIALNKMQYSPGFE